MSKTKKMFKLWKIKTDRVTCVGNNNNKNNEGAPN